MFPTILTKSRKKLSWGLREEAWEKGAGRKGKIK
jgi:hypothetical protein